MSRVQRAFRSLRINGLSENEIKEYKGLYRTCYQIGSGTPAQLDQLRALQLKATPQQLSKIRRDLGG